MPQTKRTLKTPSGPSGRKKIAVRKNEPQRELSVEEKETPVVLSKTISKIDKTKRKIESNLLPPLDDEPKKSAKSPKMNLYRKIAFSFIVLTVALLAVVFYFSFVKLDIILISAQERVSDNLTFNIHNPQEGAVFPNNDFAGAVEQIEIADSNTYSASGVEKIGEEVTGKVLIVNNYIKNQPLVATTRLLSADGKLFRIKNTINVPAGGSQEAEIYADEPSSAMAIGPTKFTLPGLWAGLQDKIYGESKEKFVYGEQQKKHIQQEDIDQAIKDLKRSLLEKAKRDIGVQYKGYDKVIYNIDENSVSTEVGGKVGEEKDKFDVSIKAKVTVVAFSGEQAGKLARNKLLESIPDNKELVGFNPDEVVYTLDKYDVSAGQATVSASFEGKMTLKADAQIIDRQKIVNLKKAQLEDYLSGFKEIAGYEIKFTPSFIDKVPNLIDRINVEVKK